MNKSWWIGIWLLCSSYCFAQYSDRELYKAYLHSDMSVWDAYLHETNWDQLSEAEQLRYLNYEYGYVATAIDTQAKDAKEHVDAFYEHIQALDGVLDESTKLTYLSSHAAYRAKLSVWEFAKQGVKAMQLAKKAVEVDRTNPLALTLLGCVDFYAPALFGGNKGRALDEFTQAESLLRTKGDTVANWNYASVNMQRAMCLAHTGKKAEAIELCRAMLVRDPEFVFIRDEYLPSLLKE